MEKQNAAQENALREERVAREAREKQVYFLQGLTENSAKNLIGGMHSIYTNTEVVRGNIQGIRIIIESADFEGKSSVLSYLAEIAKANANVYIDEKDKQTVIFAYPHLFTNTATLQVIRLEIGALAAWTPAKTALIEPYAAKYYPKIFEQKETAILTVAPERTFWEKPQSCTMKRTDRNIWKCRSGIPDIIMISTAWLQHRSKKLLFPGWIS